MDLMPLHLDESRGHFVQELAPTDHHEREVIAVDLGPVLHVNTSGAHLDPTEARELASALMWWANRKTGHPAYGDAQAWEDNYRGMAARWAECDSERLRLKTELTDALMRLRILTQTPAGGSAHPTNTPTCAGCGEREVPAAPPAGSNEGVA